MTDHALVRRIEELSRLLDETSITLLSLTADGETLTLRREITGAQPMPAVATRVVVAPCPGVFLRSHPLGGGLLTEPGLAVATGAVLGLLRIGPLLVEVSAPGAGTVHVVEASEGALVGFGTPLFQLYPEGDAP